MSLNNPKSVVSEQRLNNFYKQIAPFLTYKPETGFTPVGTIISVMGKIAPRNYLACDGQVVSINSYPELAAYFAEQFDSCNYFGGDGTTTFALPDLRGEFLRGTGTNSHTNQGSGANVGTHQDATSIPEFGARGDGLSMLMRSNSSTGQGFLMASNYDSAYAKGSGTLQNNVVSTTKSSTGASIDSFTIRPTNTSVLYCIATKNIYVDAKCDYSLEEKVVGTWIDGKPLYQKTFVYTTATTGNASVVVGNIPNLDTGFIVDGFYCNQQSNFGGALGSYYMLTNTGRNSEAVTYTSYFLIDSSSGDIRGYFGSTTAQSKIVVTARYTKTTD